MADIEGVGAISTSTSALGDGKTLDDAYFGADTELLIASLLVVEGGSILTALLDAEPVATVDVEMSTLLDEVSRI
jgi:hypothetical protein